MATTNKNFKVKNGLEVAGVIGVGSTPSYGTTGQLLSSQGAGSPPAWIDQGSAAYTSVVKHGVKLGEAIAKGQAVYVSSANGSNMIVSKANNTSEATSSKTMGLLETGGSTNAQVNVITEGILGGIDVGAAAAGDPIWLGTAGNLIYGLANKPIAPAHLVFIGIVTKTGNNGEVFIRPQNGFELNELHGVLIGSNYASVPADNNLLAFDYANLLWTNQTAEQAGVANLAGATFTGDISGTGLTLSGKNIFSSISTGAPTFTTYSSGVRTVFYNNVDGTSVGYTRGIDAGTMWDSIPAADGGMYFKWYGGQTQVASLSGTGTFTTTNVNATTVTANTLVGNTNASTITAGTIPSGILGNSTVYVGTTAVALNRTTASQTLTGVSIDGNAGTVTNGIYTTTTSLPNVTSVNSTTIPNNVTLLTTSNIGSSVQAYDADLTSIAGLANASGYLYNNGTGTFTYNNAPLTSASTLDASKLNSNTVVTLNATTINATDIYATTFNGNVNATTVTVSAIYDAGTGNKVYNSTTDTFGSGTGATKFYGNGASLTYLNASNISSGTIPSTILGNSSITINGSSIALNSTNSVITANTGNSIAIKFDSGTTENTDLYTFNGSAAKSLNIVAGSGISITKTANTITVNSTATGAANTFGTIATPSGTSPVADTTTDTLTLSAGNGITITGDATADSITFTPNVASATVNGIVTTGTQTFAGDKTFANTIIDGSTRLGSTETQKVIDIGSSPSYTSSTNTYTVNLASGNYFSNITTQRVYPTAWAEVGTGISGNSASAPAIFSLSGLSAQSGDMVIVFASTEAAVQPTTTNTSWSTQTSGSTTYAGGLFWKQMGGTPDTSIVLTSFGTNVTSFVAKAFRPTGITYGSYTPVVTVETTAWATGTTTSPNPLALTTAYANALAVTVFSNENNNTTSVTPPTGYTSGTFSTLFTSNTVSSTSGIAYKSAMISAAGTSEDAATWSYTNPAGVANTGTPAWAATTLFIQAYADPTITLINGPTGTYVASTYVLHINNPSAVTTTWSGATYAWQGGSAPTLSSTAPNNIVILETINGSTFRGALLDSYA